jgi:glycosyltransferase involved in cell wall biosynthesis
MSNKPFFSVIMPCYNYGSYIGESLTSLQNQTFENWECLVIDDGSTDNTAKEIEKIQKSDARIKYFFQNNAGPSIARNLGLKNAKGQFIQFLDADDAIERNKFFYAHAFLVKNQNETLVYGNGRVFIENNMDTLFLNHPNQNQFEHFLENSEGEMLISELVEGNSLFINMPLTETKIAQELAFDVTLDRNEDWDFWMQLALKGVRFTRLPIKELDNSLVRAHEGSLITNEIKMDLSLVQMREKWARIIQGKASELNTEKLQLANLILGIKLKQNNKYADGNKSLWNSIVLQAKFKITAFSIIALLIPGTTAMKLLKKVTGQKS